MGGLNLEAIISALNLENKLYLLDRITIYMKSAIVERHQKREPVKSFKNTKSNPGSAVPARKPRRRGRR